MPGGDGTGPVGYGPRTGRGAGYCSRYPLPGFAALGTRRRFLGTGYMRPRFYGVKGYPGPGYYAGKEADEKKYLKEQAELLKKEIDSVEARIKEIYELKTPE